MRRVVLDFPAGNIRFGRFRSSGNIKATTKKVDSRMMERVASPDLGPQKSLEAHKKWRLIKEKADYVRRREIVSAAAAGGIPGLGVFMYEADKAGKRQNKEYEMRQKVNRVKRKVKGEE